MKTTLKVVLLVVLAVVALKLLPLTVGLGFAAGLFLVGLLVAGLSLVAAVAVLGLILAAVLAPIWIPVLVVAGIVSLFRRASNRRPVTG